MQPLTPTQQVANVMNAPGYTAPPVSPNAPANAGTAQVIANQQAAAKLGVSIPGVGGVQNQSTTTLSSDKSKDVANIQNKTNTLSQSGISTNPSTGVSTYANGAIYNPEQEQPEVTTQTGGYNGDTYIPPGSPAPKDANGAEIALTALPPTAQANVDSYKDLMAKSDANTASMVAAVQSQYEELIRKQEQSNAATEAGTNKLLLRNGGLQHTASGSNVLNAQVSYGLQQVAALNSQEQMAIVQAQQAGLNNDFKLQGAINDQIEQIRQEKTAVLQKQAADLAAANKKQAEDQIKSTMENAVVNEFQQGITDPTQILQNIRANGDKTTTLEDITGALAMVNPSEDLAGLSPDYRTFLALQKTDPKISKMNWLDYQRAVTNATSKVTSSGTGTGTGTSGEVSQITQAVIQNPSLFDDLTPTNKSIVVGQLQANGYNTTNLGTKSLSDTAIKEIAQTQSAISSLSDLKQKILDNPDQLGPVTGLEALNPYSKKRELQADIDKVKQVVGKALEGGVLRKEDEDKYKKILATITDTPETAEYKINGVIDSLQQNIENYKQLQQASGRSLDVTASLSKESSGGLSDDELISKYLPK